MRQVRPSKLKRSAKSRISKKKHELFDGALLDTP